MLLLDWLFVCRACACCVYMFDEFGWTVIRFHRQLHEKKWHICGFFYWYIQYFSIKFIAIVLRLQNRTNIIETWTLKYNHNHQSTLEECFVRIESCNHMLPFAFSFSIEYSMRCFASLNNSHAPYAIKTFVCYDYLLTLMLESNTICKYLF